jgi:hypothetical protein
MELKPKVHVIFSSINAPSNTIVQESLLTLHDLALVHVITSKKYHKLWQDLGCGIQIAQFNSTSKGRVVLRKFFLRSNLLRQSLRILLNTILKNSRQIMMPPHNARHFEYVEVLRKLPDDDWAILVDSRDLIFQISPREVIKRIDTDRHIHLFLEDGKFFKDGSNQTNDKSPANWNWASQLLNNNTDKLSKLMGANIVNSGCIAGRVVDLILFFEKSCKLLSDSSYSSFSLLDQAATNVLAYDESLTSKIQLHKNGELVLNMCGVIEERVEIVNGKLLRSGHTVPIVHQFDRFGTWSAVHGLVFDKRQYRVQ